MVIDELHEPGVHLHLPDEHRLERRRHFIPCRDLFVPLRQLAVWWNYTQLLLSGNRLFAQLVPALIKLPFVLIRPFLWDMVRRVGGARREVDEERLVGREGLLLSDPV